MILAVLCSPRLSGVSIFCKNADDSLRLAAVFDPSPWWSAGAVALRNRSTPLYSPKGRPAKAGQVSSFLRDTGI